MAALAIVAVPLLIMFFALGMERVESRLRQVAVGENDVEEFLEQARPNEVLELFRHGFGRALELFRLRRPSQPQQQPLAITTGPIPTGQRGSAVTDLGDMPTIPLNLRVTETVPIRRSRAS